MFPKAKPFQCSLVASCWHVWLVVPIEDTSFLRNCLGNGLTVGKCYLYDDHQNKSMYENKHRVVAVGFF